MAGFRKRTYARAFKPKRSSRKRGRFQRRRGIGSKVTSYGNRNDFSANTAFKSRKISRKSWNHKLWDSTLQKAHYRVAATWVDSITAPANRTQAQHTIFQAMSNGNAFWTAAGGALDIDGGTIPLFLDDLVIRGGTLSVTLTYVDDTITLGDHCKLRIALIKGAQNINFGTFNGTRDANWDTTMFPEFTSTIGSVVFSREFDLQNNGTSMTFKRRIGIRKIDQGQWVTLGGARHYWYISATNPVNSASVPITLTFGMNMSFSGDIIGTA